MKHLSNNNRLKKVVNPLLSVSSRVAQWKRAGPITQRSEDQNLALLNMVFFYFYFYFYFMFAMLNKFVGQFDFRISKKLMNRE